MTLKEIEEKRKYLNSLREFTSEEIESLHNYIIRINTRLNPTVEELAGVERAYDYINYVIQEESSFPYPKCYTHPLSEAFLKSLNQIILLPYSCFLPSEKGNYRHGHNDTIDGRMILMLLE